MKRTMVVAFTSFFVGISFHEHMISLIKNPFECISAPPKK